MNEQQEREAFEAAYKHLDLSSKPDAWGNPIYLHSHIDAIWAGFKVGARWQASANEKVPSRATDISTALALPGCERLRDFAAVGPVQMAAVEEFAYALAANVPAGYKLVLVPDELAGDEPDWDECKRQAEEAYGIKVGDQTMPIIIREVRRWIAQKRAPAQEAEPDSEAVTECWQDFGRTEEFRRAVKWSQDGETPGALFVAFRAGLRAASPKAPAPEAAEEARKLGYRLREMAWKIDTSGALKAGNGWAQEALHKAADILESPAQALNTPAQAQQSSERHLRRLLAVRVGMPHTYFDDGEAQGNQHGISIDFMREPVEHIDAKLRALNVARAECAKPDAQQPLTVPHPGSPEASALIDSELAAHGWPSNTKNAARAGYEACRKLIGAGIGASGEASNG